MKAFYVVLFLTILGSVELNTPSEYERAKIAYMMDDIKIKTGVLVDISRKKIENLLSDSVEISRSFVEDALGHLKITNLATKGVYTSRALFESKAGKKFAENALALAGKALKFATKLVPYASEVLDLVQGLSEMFTEETDWKEEFKEKILQSTEKQILTNDLGHYGSFLETVKSRFEKISDTVSCVRKEYKKLRPRLNPKYVPPSLLKQCLDACDDGGVQHSVSIIHWTLETIVNDFKVRNSTYRRHPLLAASVFVELGSIVYLFEPIAMELIRNTANHTQLSCLYRDALIDHLPFVLEARFQKVNANLNNRAKVRNEPYNLNRDYLPVTEACTRCFDGIKCITDEFGRRSIQPAENDASCEISYLRHLKYLVERMFPIDMLSRTCHQTLGKPSDFGWATIKLKRFNGSHLEKLTFKNDFYGKSVHCDDTPWNKCDPYVKLYVDGINVLTTDTMDGTEDYNIDRYYYTPEIIKKSTIIKVEVLEDDGENKKADNPEKLLTKSGTVESFMQEPIRCTEPMHIVRAFHGTQILPPNCIEVDIIWQDERKK